MQHWSRWQTGSLNSQILGQNFLTSVSVVAMAAPSCGPHLCFYIHLLDKKEKRKMMKAIFTRSAFFSHIGCIFISLWAERIRTRRVILSHGDAASTPGGLGSARQGYVAYDDLYYLHLISGSPPHFLTPGRPAEANFLLSLHKRTHVPTGSR